ncbi:MAG: PQQ-binding-like beta-propeller repeat protein [Bacteroidetes bacterium]|jgi:uncharacterized protein (TIGR02145 family)|nr:PQQ-binding-like beta-propeller repeat protein [Bacteroidota bacterium]MBT7463880.1 PQQ-binding-like beta-propeller repeat protein [Bacteroidota bacterium]
MKNLIILISIFSLIPLYGISQEESAKTKFYKGIVAEEIDGDLSKAISIYQDILKTYKNDRQIAAKCLYHIGLCNDKMETGKAMDYYVDLLEKFPDQGDMASLARNQISKLEDANTFVDPRDGHKYKWVKIGNQIWMAENLAYMPHVNPLKKQEYGIWVYDYDGHDVAEAKSTENYQMYGCLYDWPTAMGLEPKYLEEVWGGDTVNHQGICPTDWHVATDGEWKELEMALGMPDSAAHDEGFNRAGTFSFGGLLYEYPPVGRFLRSTEGWNSGADGNNQSGFNALPAGARYPPGYGNKSKFSSIGELANFWTASESSYKSRNMGDYEFIWTRYLFKRNKDDIDRSTYDDRGTGSSIRCIKNYNGEYSLKNIQIRKASEFIKPLPEKSILESYPSPEIIWEIKSHQTSIFARIYHNQVISNSDSSFCSIDINTGEKLWEKSTEKRPSEFRISGSSLLYLSSGKLICRNIETWQKIWEYKAKEDGKGITIFEDFVVLQAGGRFSRNPSKTNSIHCLNVTTGNLIWEQPIDYNFGSRAAISDNTIVFGTHSIGQSSEQDYCIALDLITGDEKWKYEVGDAILSDPVINNMVVVFGCTDDYVYALRLDNGSKIWRYFADNRIYADPTIYKNTVFIGDLGDMWDEFSQASSFHAIDLTTGKQKWIASQVCLLENDGIFNEGSTIYNNTIVVGGNKGTNFAFDIESGNLEWKFNGGAGIPWSVVSNGILVIRTRSGIYGIKPPL